MEFSKNNREKLDYLNNEDLEIFLKRAVEICQPEKITILTDSEEDLDYVRDLALESGSEIPLKFKKHTCHFDGYSDQARDKKNTKY